MKAIKITFVALAVAAIAVLQLSAVQAQQMRHSTVVPQARAVMLAAPVQTQHRDTSCTYRVRPGDWLSKIAPKNWRLIAQINHLTNPNLIFPNEVLILCASSQPQSSTASVTQHVVPAPRTPQPPSPQPQGNVTVSGAVLLAGEPCKSAAMWPSGPVGKWMVPVSCYGGVYQVNHGDCYGWVAWLHGGHLPTHVSAYPIPGSVARISAGVQGAGASGHYAQVIAVRGNLMLVSEENMYWRGGGYNRVTYRYMEITPGITYLY